MLVGDSVWGDVEEPHIVISSNKESQHYRWQVTSRCSLPHNPLPLQSCPSLLCRHARSILRVDVMHRGKLDPLSLGWFLWVAGREVVDHASRVQAMAHAVAAAAFVL